ncbi:hypothetical protein QBC44DRAFT_251997 [Cladorrhinum sp. PSN332]|nr:hypothetical protein QBC44DRAFT_251997 [Cladorrhinum sp. PSN332]
MAASTKSADLAIASPKSGKSDKSDESVESVDSSALSVTKSSSSGPLEGNPLIEFYLATCWIYTPKAVKRIFDTLYDLQSPDVEIIFQTDWNWFRAICHDADAKALRLRFYRLAKEITKDAFDGDFSPLLGPDGRLNYGTVDNEWIIGVNEVISIKRIKTKNYDAYRYPAAIDKFLYKHVWEDGNEDGQVVHLNDFLTEDQRLKLQRDYNVTITHDLTGNTLYIGGHDEASVFKTRARLRVMLSAKTIELSAGRFEHLLYAENWDDGEIPFTADMRHMTNIDPRLTSSTLIDSAKVRNLESAYERMYKVGVSIRLCEYSMLKNCYVSTFGPSVRGRTDHKQDHVLGGRPATCNKIKEETVDVPKTPGRSGKSGIDAWIASIPDPAALGSPSLQAAEPPFDTEQEAFEYYSWLTSDIAADGKLIDIDAPAIGELIDIESPVESSTSVSNVPPFPLPRNLILTSIIATDNTSKFKRYNDPSVLNYEAMKKQEKNHNEGHPHLIDIDEAIQGWMPEPGFTRNLEDALKRLLISSPFRSGILELKAEFGRAILGEVDESALAFNRPNVRSNGWHKWDILNKLNAVTSVVSPVEQRNRIHFTKVLTTSGADVEDLINMQNIFDEGKRFWTTKPASSWTVYSFRCISEMENRSCQFVIEIEDHGSASNSPKHLNIMIKPVHPAHDAEGVTPLYVHAIRCNWDLRFMLTHIDCKKMESIFGDFANRLFRGLEITWGDGPDLKFSIPTSSVSVKNARVLTKWRHSSPDLKSALEITEVEQMDVKQLSWHNSNPQGMLQKNYHARRYGPETSKKMKRDGDPTRWYEAAVVSTVIEDVFKMNSLISPGEKADWEVPNLQAMKAFPPLYESVLTMVRLMDRIGGDNDNGRGNKLWGTLARGNDPEKPVVGMTAAEPPKAPWKKEAESTEKDSKANNTKHKEDAPEVKFY